MSLKPIKCFCANLKQSFYQPIAHCFSRNTSTSGGKEARVEQEHFSLHTHDGETVCSSLSFQISIIILGQDVQVSEINMIQTDSLFHQSLQNWALIAWAILGHTLLQFLPACGVPFFSNIQGTFAEMKGAWCSGKCYPTASSHQSHIFVLGK